MVSKHQGLYLGLAYKLVLGNHAGNTTQEQKTAANMPLGAYVRWTPACGNGFAQHGLACYLSLHPQKGQLYMAGFP